MGSLLPPNRTALEHALEQVSARLSDLPVPIGDLWNPQRCPEALLPWLAWAVSVVRWDADWPPDTKRAVIAHSAEMHRLNGTRAAVRGALDDVGAVYDLEENPGGAHHTLAIEIHNSASIHTPALAALRRQLDSVMRASVHFTLSLNAGWDAAIPVAAGIGAATVADFRCEVNVS